MLQKNSKESLNPKTSQNDEEKLHCVPFKITDPRAHLHFRIFWPIQPLFCQVAHRNKA